MKRTAWLLVFWLTAAVLAAGCGSGGTAIPTPSVVVLGQQFALKVGQTQAIKDENLSVKFVAVAADSRCPLGAECIQAGEARCQVQVISRQQVSNLELVEIGLSKESTSALMGQYRVSFQVTPYPEVGKTVKSSDYVLTLTITR
jgi:hypothetical protein